MRKRLAKKIFNQQVKQLVYTPGCILVVDNDETAQELAMVIVSPEWKGTPIVRGHVELHDALAKRNYRR